jgi:ABC-type transport system substrate-binding protein
VGPSAIQLQRPACGTLLAYPNKRLPAGLVLAPELAVKDPIVSADRKRYTFTIRRDARFSTGARDCPRRRPLPRAHSRPEREIEIDPFVETPTDQNLPPTMPGFRNARIYPLKGPDLRRARALARGNTRSGKAVLYTCTGPECIAPAQILQQNLKKIGLDVRIRQFPIPLQLEKMATRGEPFDIGRVWYTADRNDPAEFVSIFDGRDIRRSGSGNLSYFDSPTHNKLIARPARRSGAPLANARTGSWTCSWRGTPRRRFPTRTSTSSRSSRRMSAASSSIPRST